MKELSLRECAFVDAAKHGPDAVKQLTEKCRKRGMRARTLRGASVQRRYERDHRSGGKK